jgi:hypothetical protein
VASTPPVEVWTAQDADTNVVSWPQAPDTSRLYYEAHITVPPLNNAQLAVVEQLCSAHDWHRSTFELHKGGQVPNAFVSCRDTSRNHIIARTGTMLRLLLNAGFTVLRWKVEDTLLDSKRGDRLLPSTEHLTPAVPRHGIYTPQGDVILPAGEPDVAP